MTSQVTAQTVASERGVGGRTWRTELEPIDVGCEM